MGFNSAFKGLNFLQLSFCDLLPSHTALQIKTIFTPLLKLQQHLGLIPLRCTIYFFWIPVCSFYDALEWSLSSVPLHITCARVPFLYNGNNRKS